MLNLIKPLLGGDTLLIANGQYSLWQPELVGLYLLSNGFIALACSYIALMLVNFARRWRARSFTWMFLLLGGLVTACGTTHVIEIWTLWHPSYWLSGAIKLLTAAISISAAGLLPVIAKTLSPSSLAELEAANQGLQQQLTECKRVEKERKQVEHALRESENRFQAFMNNSPTASWITDSKGRVLYLSQTYCRLLQIPDHAVGKTVFELFSPEIAEPAYRNIQQVVETNQTVEAVEVAPRPDGTLGKFLVYKFPICELSGQCLVGGVAVDITDSDETKEELRSLNNRLQYLLTHAPVMIFSCKADGDYGATSISQNAKTILGYEPQEFLKSSSFWANHIHPEDRAGIVAGTSQIFVTGQHTHEYRFLHADGAYRWVYNQLQLIRDDEGNPVEIIGYLIDVSERQAALQERRQTEIAIQQSEARYRAIVEDQTELIVRFRPDGILTFVNDAYCRFFGMEREKLVGHRYEPVVFAEDREMVAQQVQLITLENPTVVIENRVVVGQEVRWTQWVNRALFDEQGELSEFQAVGRDIHILKQAEEALRRYERIVSTTTDAIALLDRNYVYQVVNQAYLSWHHKQQEDIIGHSVSQVLSQELFENTIKPRLDECLAGQVIQYEMWVEYPTLGPQFLSVTYDPYFDANQTISGVVISLRNITRLKQAETELKLQGIIVKNMAEGVCMIKAADGMIVYANPKFERMFEYEVGELKNKHISNVNYGDETLSAEEVSQMITQVVTQHNEATYEVHNVKKDGTPFWCRATTSIFQHPEHGVVMVAVHQDITEQKRAEEQIKASLKEKEVLLKEIHHRVKNNLGIVDGLLQMQFRRSTDPQVVEVLKESQHRIASIALVHEKLYRSEDLANIDFAQYILDLTAHLFDSYNIHFNNVNLTTHLDNISLDIDMAIPCGLIVNELVSNALKYAFPKTQSGEIQIEFRQNQDQTLVLTVQDNGIGLPQDFNLKQTKTLGISLVQGLTKQLRGTLKIDSGPGTTFRITFAKGKK